MKKMTSLLLLLLSISTAHVLQAQIMLKQVSLKKQIENSNLVVEGKVISKVSFWDAKRHYIYTANTVEVYKVFKGTPLKTIEVITIGGSVGLKALVANPSLKLKKGDVGVFILKSSDIDIGSKLKFKNRRFKPYGASQGFYKYNLFRDIAVNPFNKKKGINTSFYNEIKTYTKTEYVKTGRFDTRLNTLKTNRGESAFPPGSIIFTPATATAGTKSVLTISGTGFGNVKGHVGFSDADDGGDTFVNALDTQVLSWTNTEIRVEIPSDAGTGQIQITHNDNSIGVSSETLRITYAEINIESDDVPNANSGVDYAYQAQHINNNRNGGYTWEMYADFFNDSEHPGAKASFERAIETWRCNSHVNWVISDLSTSVDSAVGLESDGINIVRFDNGDELGDDILGTCYSWYSGCATGGVSASWYVSEMDIVFDDATNWYFGTESPGINQFDFQSVATHELGHGHQLAHVINDNNDIMHFELSNGKTLRDLSENNIEAANSVQSRSVSAQICSETTMSNFQCGSGGNSEALENLISLFPIPTDGKFYVKNESELQLNKIVVFDIRGRMIVEYSGLNLVNPISVDFNGKYSGVYFVDIYAGSDVVTKKIVVE